MVKELMGSLRQGFENENVLMRNINRTDTTEG